MRNVWSLDNSHFTEYSHLEGNSHLTDNSHHKENFHLTEGKDGAKAGGRAGCGQARPEAKVIKLAMMILMNKHNDDQS